MERSVQPRWLIRGRNLSVMACLNAQIQCDRRVAALRTIEALRLHAVSHDGKLPESLGHVTEVPIPDDPATGKPLENTTATEQPRCSWPLTPD